MKARLANGRDYDNRYCWVMKVSNGKVRELREYMNGHAGFAMIFGDNPPGKII